MNNRPKTLTFFANDTTGKRTMTELSSSAMAPLPLRPHQSYTNVVFET
jgi:hypothetical protein